jgi:hypothetical protein
MKLDVINCKHLKLFFKDNMRNSKKFIILVYAFFLIKRINEMDKRIDKLLNLFLKKIPE